MTRLLVLVLLVVAAVVAYPWVGVVAGVILVASLAVAAGRARRRRVVRPGPVRPVPVPLERRVALRRAWRELHSIERAAGLPPTVPPKG